MFLFVALLLIFVAKDCAALTAQLHSERAEAARVFCEGLSASPSILLSKLAANRCIVKPNFVQADWLNAVCPVIAGLRKGRLGFPYSRPVSKVITGPMSTTFAGPFARSWLALYQVNELDEPAGNWALLHHDGTPLYIPNEAIVWFGMEPDDTWNGIGTVNNPTTERIEFYHTNGGDSYSMGELGNGPMGPGNEFDLICEYELDMAIPGQFELIGKNIGLAPVLVIEQKNVGNLFACGEFCWNAYICGSFSYNQVTNQCQLYWIHSQHPNFAANKITMSNTVFYDVI